MSNSNSLREGSTTPLQRSATQHVCYLLRTLCSDFSSFSSAALQLPGLEGSCCVCSQMIDVMHLPLVLLQAGLVVNQQVSGQADDRNELQIYMAMYWYGGTKSPIRVWL